MEINIKRLKIFETILGLFLIILLCTAVTVDIWPWVKGLCVALFVIFLPNYLEFREIIINLEES